MAVPVPPGGLVVNATPSRPTPAPPRPNAGLDLAELTKIAGGVFDPELPPLTLADLGILRSVEQAGDRVVVTLTPTYSGCPAVEYIEDEVRRALTAAGCDDVQIVRAFNPTWTTDWISDEGRRKLTEAGIAPPSTIATGRPTGATPVAITAGVRVAGPIRATGTPPVLCPRCGAGNTREISRFGSTACKALHHCNDCNEPFDHFKAI